MTTLTIALTIALALAVLVICGMAVLVARIAHTQVSAASERERELHRQLMLFHKVGDKVLKHEEKMMEAQVDMERERVKRVQLENDREHFNFAPEAEEEPPYQSMHVSTAG